ncbi:hypothetical protein ACWD4N_33135 [Streptomyces sp. NPDC002586]
MPSDFRQLQRYARVLGLTYQQVLARYHAACGKNAPRSGAVAWARMEVKRAQDPVQAREELRAGYVDSRTRRSWEPLGFRLDPEVQALLTARVKVDQEVLPRISPGHYLDAALRTGPQHLPEQLACMRDFLTARGGPLTRGRPLNYSVGPDAHKTVLTLRLALAGAQLPGEEVPAVVSALTSRFLSRLPATAR